MSQSDRKPIQLWAIGTVRNEADILRVNVLHHLSEGIDRFLFMDDGSSDDTRAVLQDLSEHCPLEWHQASSTGFDQQQLLTHLARTAAARGADWIIPIDADEFWHAPGSSIRKVLANCTAAALRVEVVNFVQQRERLDAGGDAVAHMTWRTAAPQGDPDTIAHLVESGAVAYVEIAYPPKWAFRASDQIVVGWGNHNVSGTSGETVTTANLVCLHAPLRSKADMVRKLDLNRPVEELGDYLGRAWHLKRWRKLAAEGKLDSEWRANSHEAGAVELHGERRLLVEDNRLRQLVAPWLPRQGTAALSVDAPQVTRLVGDAVAAARDVEGWFALDELELLSRAAWWAAARVSHAPTVVEIGSYCGRSTVALGTVLKAFGPEAIVHAIDPHQGELGAIDSPIGLGSESSTFDRFNANVKQHVVDGTVRVIRARSTNVAWQTPIDYLLIDGLHDYDGVLSDVLHFEPWLRRGALIAVHDDGETFPGVQAVVRQMLATQMYVLRDRAASLVILQRVGEGQGLRENPQEPLETRIAVRDQTIALMRQSVAELAQQQRRTMDALTACRAALAETERSLGDTAQGAKWLEQSKRELLESRSWRWTAPLRAALALFRRT